MFCDEGLNTSCVHGGFFGSSDQAGARPLETEGGAVIIETRKITSGFVCLLRFPWRSRVGRRPASSCPPCLAKVEGPRGPRGCARDRARPHSRIHLPDVPGSNFEFDADLHDLPARNFKICARALGVVGHQGEERLAPSRQAGAAAGRSISSRRTQACPSPNKAERPFCASLCQRRSPYWGMGDRGCGRFPRLAGSNDEEGRLPGDETTRIESIDHAVPNVRSKASLRSRGADYSAPKSFRIKASSELRPDL